MGRTRTTLRVAREDYDAFARILGGDPEFPKSYDLWLEQIAQEDEKCRARGDVLNAAEVHPQEFADWCRRSGLDARFQNLSAFAVYKANRKG